VAEVFHRLVEAEVVVVFHRLVEAEVVFHRLAEGQVGCRREAVSRLTCRCLSSVEARPPDVAESRQLTRRKIPSSAFAIT
jgi:hypothetical protein